MTDGITINGRTFDPRLADADTPREIAEALATGDGDIAVLNLAGAIAERLGLTSVDALIPPNASFSGTFDLAAYSRRTGRVPAPAPGDALPRPTQRTATTSTERVPPVPLGTPLQRSLNYTDPSSPGRHSLLSPVVGNRALELEKVLQLGAAHPEFTAFACALYDVQFIALVRPDQRELADRLAQTMFAGYLRRYDDAGLTPENAVQWVTTDMPGAASNKTWTIDLENEWNTWFVNAIVERQGQVLKGGYLPPGLVAYHELMHVEEIARGAKSHDDDFDPLREVLTTLKTVCLADEINKRLNGIPMNTQVDYGRDVTWPGHSIPIGQLANAVRSLERTHGNLAAAVASPDFAQLIGIAGPESASWTSPELLAGHERQR